MKFLIDSVKAQRGVLFLKRNSRLSPKIFLHMSQHELKTPYFEESLSEIDRSAKTQKSSLVVNRKTVIDGKETLISSLCVPLVHKDRLLGVVYADIISDTDTFRESDLFAAEIFSSQASISLFNAMLTTRVKVENPVYKPTIGFGYGVMNFYGEVHNNHRSPVSGPPAYKLNIATFLDKKHLFKTNFFIMSGTMTGNERSVADTARNWNFKSDIFSIGINFHYDFGRTASSKAADRQLCHAMDVTESE